MAHTTFTHTQRDRALSLGLLRLLAHWYHNDGLSRPQRKQVEEALLHQPTTEALARLDAVLSAWAYEGKSESGLVPGK